MSKDDEAELFEIQARGVMAAAFAHKRKVPSKQQWGMLRGATEITMRDIAEIGVDTNTFISLQVAGKNPPKDENQESQS